MAWQGLSCATPRQKVRGSMEGKGRGSGFPTPLMRNPLLEWLTHSVIIACIDGSKTPITLLIIFNIVFLYFANVMKYILILFTPNSSQVHSLNLPPPHNSIPSFFILITQYVQVVLPIYSCGSIHRSKVQSPGGHS